MKTTLLRIAVLTIIMVFAASMVSGQSLLDNPDYKNAKELQKKAREAMDAGDYDKAAEYAEESKEYLEKSDEYVAAMLLKYRANGKIQLAEEKLSYARGIGAEVSVPETYNKAKAGLADAKKAYTSEDYESSIEYAENVISLLEGIQPVKAATTETLPKYYTVRLIPERRDCFWLIAEYSFVYGDPWKWPTLYEANKDKLEDPENPRIIQPGMVFEIPSIDGELREGMYQPPDEEK
jgi:tetratricopeptide (TPR) repeat protein